jgi:hypothetical protein
MTEFVLDQIEVRLHSVAIGPGERSVRLVSRRATRSA